VHLIEQSFPAAPEYPGVDTSKALEVFVGTPVLFVEEELVRPISCPKD
jgi:hypothetical protein